MNHFKKIETLNICKNGRWRRLFLLYINESFYQNNAEFGIRILFDLRKLIEYVICCKRLQSYKLSKFFSVSFIL
jgi:hypothetical protein